jgi:hypothetical protein
MTLQSLWIRTTSGCRVRWMMSSFVNLRQHDLRRAIEPYNTRVNRVGSSNEASAISNATSETGFSSGPACS